MSKESRRILIYCPEGSVQPHHVSTLTLGRILEGQGHRVDVAFCDALYERCTVMNSIALPPGVARDQLGPLCAQCGLNSRHTIQSMGMRLVELAPYHLHQDVYEAVRVVEAFADTADVVYDGIAFGALARQDLFLARKLLADQPLEPADWARLRETVRTALVVYAAIKRMVAEKGYTDILVFESYAINTAAALAARSAGISFRFVSNAGHRNVDRRRLTVDPANGFEVALRHLKSWPLWRDLPLTPAEVVEVGYDILHRFSGIGSHSYSPAKQGTNPLELLGLRRDRKLVLALTSSLDERQAAEFLGKAWSPDLDAGAINSAARAFPDQISWLTAMCDWASARDDLQLVIRIHPREGPNKREGGTSSHLIRLREVLRDLPDNVRVVWPEDSLSTYDLMEIAHLVQCSWSTVGIEAARLGVPVMSSDPYCTYPPGDFIKVASSPEQFLRLTETMLAEGPNFERAALGLRFYGMTRLHASVSIEDINPDAQAIAPKRFDSAAEAAIFEELLLRPVGAEEIKVLQRPAATPEAYAAEQATIHYLFRAMVRYMFTGAVSGEDYRLVTIPAASQSEVPPPTDPGVVHLLLRGDACEFVTSDGAAIQRYSPMIARMAALCGTELVSAGV